MLQNLRKLQNICRQSTEGILESIFEAFRTQRRNEKIYVIIDEYDHFANELLGFKTDEFKELIAKKM
mgnify:CR=1 FL=1